MQYLGYVGYQMFAKEKNMDQIYYETKEKVTEGSQKAYAKVVKLDLESRLDEIRKNDGDFFYRNLTCKDDISYTVQCSAHIGEYQHNKQYQGKDVSEISSDITIYGANILTQTKIGVYDFENTKFKIVFENISAGAVCSKTIELSYLSRDGNAFINGKGFCLKDNDERFSADIEAEISLQNSYIRDLVAQKPNAFMRLMENTFLNSIDINLYSPMGLVRNKIFDNLSIYKNKLSSQEYHKIQHFNENGGSLNIKLKPIKRNMVLVDMLHYKSQPSPKIFDMFNVVID